MTEVANLEVQSGTYSIKDNTARTKITNIVNGDLPNKASARVWNVVTDGGADPTAGSSSQSAFDIPEGVF